MNRNGNTTSIVNRLGLSAAFLTTSVLSVFPISSAFADSVNSPNIVLNVDTNRSTGAGAGNVAVTVNTITFAETMLAEYSSGTGKAILLKVRPGYQFDSTSTVTAISATFGINGRSVNVAAPVVPSGAADETLTFNLTSGGSSSVQDLVRVNGVKIKILSAAGAAGPAQNTIATTTTAVGGAFSNQGIVGASISKGAADHLVFAAEPGSSAAGSDILPAVKIVDFGGNLLTSESRTISLALDSNPGSATLLGTATRAASSGVATWDEADDLRLTVAATGYTLQATHDGAAFLTSDTVSSQEFNITAGDPGALAVSVQPADTTAGGDIVLSVQTKDEFGNPTTTSGVLVTLDSAINPGGWPLLVDSSLTKSTVNGVATWDSTDHLRITKAIATYQLLASGLGAPVTTDTFAISAGAPQSLRFVQEPESAREDEPLDPAIVVETVDQFGNRTDSSDEIALSLSPLRCGSVTSGVETATSGLATFGTAVLPKPCRGAALKASATGLVGALSDIFNISAKDSTPIALRSASLKKRKLFRFSANGQFAVSKKSKDDPTVRGGVLTVTGTTGSVTYKLPKLGWRSIAGGFEFSSNICESVKVTKKSISAVCRKKTGSLDIPESELDIVLSLGKGTAEFCGNCGGTSVGNESKVFRRTSCAAPAVCP